MNSRFLARRALILAAVASLALWLASPARAAQPLIAVARKGPQWHKKVSFDFVDANLEYALGQLAKAVGCNIVTKSPTHEHVTAFLRGVPADRALSAILAATGYEAKMLTSNTLFVGTPQDVHDMAGVAEQKPPVLSATPSVEVIRLRKARAENVAAVVRSVYPGVGVTALPAQNLIIIRVPPLP